MTCGFVARIIVRDLKLNNLPIMSGGRKIAFDEYGYHRIGFISSLN